MTRNSRQLTKTILLLAFLAGGLLLVQAQVLSFWLWCVLAALTIALRMVTNMDTPFDELSVSDEGLTRRYGTRLRKQAVETLRWDELERVEAVAHATGPEGKDLLFLLHGKGDQGVAVPGTLAQQHALVAQLRRRLPGLQEDLLAQAQAATGRANFLLWERAAA